MPARRSGSPRRIRSRRTTCGGRTALEEAEARAAALRTQLLSASALWFSAPGVTAPIPAPATERTKRLLSRPPPGALSAPDKAIALALQGYFAALLADPDASLAMALARISHTK
jgi:hypothetical protein